MHVLGHSFSQKRKSTKRPRDLYIRKISFSGSSVSDGSLSSSSGSTVSAGTAIPPSQYRTSTIIASPVSAAPLRLHERPFKDSRPSPTTFYYDEAAVSDEDDFGIDDVDEVNEIIEVEGTQFHMELPPHAVQPDHTGYETSEPSDYFFFKQVASRPPMPRSRWSESTIQTLDQHDVSSPTPIGDGYYYDADEDDEDEPVDAEASGPPTKVEYPPNFSYKRTVSAPEARRPPLRTMDSLDDFIKRGGWKRRGIVFDRREFINSDTFTI